MAVKACRVYEAFAESIVTIAGDAELKLARAFGTHESIVRYSVQV